MTGWNIEFEGTISQGTWFKPMSKPIDFSGSGITSRNPEYHDLDPEGKIFGEVAAHFRITPPYSITLRLWHPFDNRTRMQIKKTWVLP
jgi:hypothetical protein